MRDGWIRAIVPTMQHRIAHDLPDELAKKAVSAALESYSERFQKYDVTGRWTAENRAVVSFAAKGVTLEGALTLQPGAVIFEMDVPFLLRPFAGKATRKVEEHVQKWIDKAKNGELDERP